MQEADDKERERKLKRNVRLTAAALWLVAGSIFCYMLAKYYWLNAK
jgi:hypothetical protein